jgi:predicted permease
MVTDFLLRLRSILKRSTVNREIDDELQFHLDRQVEAYEKVGIDHSEAIRRARLEFGGLDQTKEEYRDALGTRMLEESWRDLRYGVRALLATPLVSIVVLLSLSLGVGANTAIFSLVNALMLRSLPVVRPDRLVIVSEMMRDSPAWSHPAWEQIHSRSGLFDGAFAWSDEQFNLTAGGEAQFVHGLFASGEFFDVLGVQAALGRTFATADSSRGGGPDGPVAVISHEFWQRHFGGSSGVLGQPLMIGSVALTVIGVTPSSFFGPDVGRRADVMLPLGVEPLLRGADSGLDLVGRNWLRIMLRLKPEQSVDAATAALRGIQAQIRAVTISGVPEQQRSIYLQTPLSLTSASTGRSALRSQYSRPLVALMLVAGLVLLIACLNIANLMLARADARRREICLRMALGATRAQLARLALMEAAVLSVVGALVGVGLSRWLSGQLIQQLSTPSNLVVLELRQDWRIFGFAIALAATTTVLLGLLPAWQAGRANLGDALKTQVRGLSGTGRFPLASGLVCGQVAVSLVLVVAAGLFIRTFASLVSRDVGFTKDRVLIVNVAAPMTRYTLPRLVPVYERIREAIAGVPGVQQAALSDGTPVGGSSRTNLVDVPNSPLAESERLTLVNVVSPGWLATYGTRILGGRDIAATDQPNTVPVALVNQTFARKFLGRNDPVGHTVRVGVPGAMNGFEIVGLVQDAVYRSLREPAPPTIYTATSQRRAARPSVNVSVSAVSGSPMLLARSIEQAISQIDPSLVLRFSLLTTQVDAALNQERLLAILSGCFGALGLLLAALGLYGLTAYSVTRRRAEIGIRMALGATTASVIGLTMRRVGVMVAIGIAIGGMVSLWASRYVTALVWGFEPRNPATFAGAAMLLTLVATVAAWRPARRAAHIDPAVVLREN